MAAERVTWASLLEDASQNANNHTQPKNILILGDEGVGKSALVAKLQGRKNVAEDKPLGTGMEYTYFDAKDEESEDVERMGCFVLNGTADSSYMLQLAVTQENMEDVLVMVVVDLSRPWHIMDSLERWSNAIGEHIEPFASSDKMEALKAKRVKLFQTFSEDGIDNKKDSSEEEVVLDLDEGVLETNFGVPMIVVVNKSDTIDSLSADLDYHQEHLDFIQLHIRRFCLKHGAGLVYVGKGNKNKEELYRSLLNLAYGRSLKSKANIADNDAIFVPCGWDNPTKINVLTDSFQSIKPEDSFNDQIKDQQLGSHNKNTPTVEAEDVQEFLKKQQPLLGSSKVKDPAAGKPEPQKERTPAALTTPRVAAASRVSSGGGSNGGRASPAGGVTRPPKTPTKAAAGGKKDDNQDKLADFFNKLLQNKGSGAGGAKTRPPASS